MQLRGKQRKKLQNSPVVPEILVELVPDFTKLKTGIDDLVDNGTISKEMAALFKDANKSLDQFAEKFKKIGASPPASIALAKKTIADLSKSGIKDMGLLQKKVQDIGVAFKQGFADAVEQALKETGASMAEFNGQVERATVVEKSLKQELREITEQLAAMKLRGEENTQQYQALSIKAGEYRDALQDVTAEINRTASDTRKLDTALEFVTGLTSAFTILQGVQALAGDENEEFQKTMLKVNAAMSILIGLQQIQNVLQKESNLIRLITLTQQKLMVVTTNLETAATSRNVIVKGAATVATRILNAVMRANPAFLLIAAFAALAGAITLFTGKTKDAADETARFNRELEKQNDFLDKSTSIIDKSTKIAIEKAKQRGATEKEVADIVNAGLRTNAEEIDFYAKKSADAAKGAASNVFFSTKGALDLTTRIFTSVAGAAEALNNVKDFKVTDAFKDLNKTAKESVNRLEAALTQTVSFFQKIDDINQQIDLNNEEAKTKDAEDRREREKKALEDAKKAPEQRAKAEAEAREKGFQDFVAKQRLRLVAVEKGSDEELQINKDLLKAELQLALNNDTLTFNQRKLLIHQYFQDVRALDSEFQKDRKRRVTEDAISLINAELAAIKLSFAEREQLTIELLEKQRELELSQVVNNKAKEKEINAKYDREIYEQRRQIRKAAFEQELADIERENFQRRRNAQDTSSDETKPFEERKKALEDNYNFEFEIITRRRLENQKNLRAGLVDLAEYSRIAKDISNDEYTVRSAYEKQYTDLVTSESEKRKADFEADLQYIVDLTNQLLDGLKSFLDTMAASEDARIDAQKENLQLMREGNAITEKEFLQRMKNIEKFEKETKRRQAEREKSLALFEAFINGAAAIIKASSDPFRLAVTIALVTAQIAAIASRPIPKFGKGTKSAPKGFGEVGETGTEIIQTDKGYFVAEHPQIVWFKGGERVYNPIETAAMMETPRANMTVINNSQSSTIEKSLDYGKMAKKIGDEIAKHPRNVISLDEHGFSVHMLEKNNVKRYLNKRFTFND
jgi:hypothetical protein